MDILAALAQEFHLKAEQIHQTVALMDDGCTIPFIARYRKEMTGSLDDQTLHAIADRLHYLRNLEARKEEVKAAIAAQEKLTDTLSTPSISDIAFSSFAAQLGQSRSSILNVFFILSAPLFVNMLRSLR